ncbi:hypothetical protein ACK3TF_000128 [Chlorella vulgaris]
MGNRAAQVERPCLLPPGFGAPGPALPRPSNAPNDAQHEAIVHRRELRRAALLKRQVAGMEASPSMLTPAAAEVRDSILAAGPDTAPSSSFEEVPSHKSCYFGPLLDEHIQLFKPT